MEQVPYACKKAPSDLADPASQASSGNQVHLLEEALEALACMHSLDSD